MKIEFTKASNLARLGSALALGLIVSTSAVNAQSAPDPSNPRPGTGTTPGTPNTPTNPGVPSTDSTSGAKGQTTKPPAPVEPSSTQPSSTQPSSTQPTSTQPNMPATQPGTSMKNDTMSPSNATVAQPMDALKSNPNGADWLSKFNRPSASTGSSSMKHGKQSMTPHTNGSM